MYDELVKRMRKCATEAGACKTCELDSNPSCTDVLMEQAADAIEELVGFVQEEERDRDEYRERLDKANDAIEELSKPKWIPVKERLPIGGDDSGAVCENVCLFMDDGTVSCGWMNGITKKAYYLNARDDVVIKAPITRVTHWMPLPPAPKEET